jgi:hypothetical protein
MMFAHAVKGDIPNQHHLIILLFENLLQMATRLEMKSPEDLGIHASDSGRSFQQTVAVRVFTDSQQNFSHSRFNTLLIDNASFWWNRTSGEDGV